MQYLAIDPGKKCHRCLTHKPLTEFYRQLEGHRTTCKVCCSEQAKEYRAKYDTPEKMRATKMRQNYGLTVEQYDEMHDKQSGLCAICFEDKPPLDVDHCHDTKRVRGLLCRSCNLMLGHIKDNVMTLRAAIDYLEK